ncbi:MULTISPECIES: PEP-CTERM sorting domain-containing protein [Levilactobacillus]
MLSSIISIIIGTGGYLLRRRKQLLAERLQP